MKLTILYFNDVHGYLAPHPELFYEGEKDLEKTAGGYSGLRGNRKEARTHVVDALSAFLRADLLAETIVQSKAIISI